MRVQVDALLMMDNTKQCHLSDSYDLKYVKQVCSVCTFVCLIQSTYLLAPVQTIFPELKMRAVVLGSLILIMTAAKRFGLYSAFLACKAIFFRSSLHPRLTVHTMFLKESYHSQTLHCN